ncbi:hypothetical protein V1477_008638 [Vespula maculifrons]|uniref:Uncharacterized protein n=1 Tax=Vespula maculifrons TaxID=7453 RepID=A0ABD2CE01_VESMC
MKINYYTLAWSRSLMDDGINLSVLLAPLNRRNDENFEKNPFSGKKKGRIMNPLATIATDFEELKERRYMYTQKVKWIKSWKESIKSNNILNKSIYLFGRRTDLRIAIAERKSACLIEFSDLAYKFFTLFCYTGYVALAKSLVISIRR